jgi:LL-diaminopimelate aminotransferase
MDGDQGWLVSRNQEYCRRRDRVLSGLNAVGLHADSPQAGLYVWSPIPDGWRSEAFVTHLLETVSLSLTPGTLFGKQGEGFVRISLSAPYEFIDQAMDRLADWMGKWA